MSTTDIKDFLDFMKDDSVKVLPDDRIEAVKSIEVNYFKISALGAKAEMLKIEDVQGVDTALKLAREAKDISKDTEEKRKKLIEPFRRDINIVNDCAKTLQHTLDMIEGTLTVKLASWQLTQEIKAQEAQKEAKKLSEALGMSIEILAPNAPKTLSNAVASTVNREKITFIIEDASLIPDEYWTVDEKEINRHISMGKKDIPGIRIFSEKTLSIRSK